MAIPGNKLKVPKAIADQVQLINDSVPLPQPLRLGAIARCLIELGKDTAVELLNGLAEDAPGVDDPNVWVLEAAQAIWEMGPDVPEEVALEEQAAGGVQGGGLSKSQKKKNKKRKGGAGGGGGGGEEGFGYQGMRHQGGMEGGGFRGGAGFGGGAPPAWLTNAVHEVCNHPGLCDPPLDPDTVLMMLSDLPMGAAKFILQRAQAKADTISDPIGFIESKAGEQREALAKKQAKQVQKEANIAAEAQRQAMSAAKKQGLNPFVHQPVLQDRSAARVGGKQDKVVAQLPEHVHKRIQWLNQNGGLMQPVDMSRVSGALVATQQASQVAVLARLKEQGPGIEDPNAWLIKELRSERRQEQIRGGVVAAIGEVTVRRIEWLNTKGGLLQPLELQVARGPLQSVGPEVRAEVLNTLKEQALGIEDPAAFLVTECRRIRTEALEAAAEQGDEEAVKRLAKKRRMEEGGEGITV
mmetsp:Transcript_79819/g.158124  ORF Transcript_79819/g.158124 Transcript_79819/m.158124 type:complete len:467 (+) Transcript_79819:67-1467(+)